VAATAGIASVFLWGALGLALVVIPLVGIGVMIREIYRELRGERPTYTVGTADLSDLPAKRKRFDYFSTRFPNDGADEYV